MTAIVVFLALLVLILLGVILGQAAKLRFHLVLAELNETLIESDDPVVFGRVLLAGMAKAVRAKSGLIYGGKQGLTGLKLRGAHGLDQKELGEAATDILRKLEAAGVAGGKLLAQKFLPGGHEVILGAKRDPHFGPTVVFGLGGIFTEILKDVAIGLAPLTPAGAKSLIAKTKGYAVLRGARGQAPADIDALADTLVRLSWLVADNPGIAELDLNPVKVFEAGRGCRVVDARILVG